eukprot:2218030-Amphidinium_carterae.1
MSVREVASHGIHPTAIVAPSVHRQYEKSWRATFGAKMGLSEELIGRLAYLCHCTVSSNDRFLSPPDAEHEWSGTRDTHELTQCSVPSAFLVTLVAPATDVACGVVKGVAERESQREHLPLTVWTCLLCCVERERERRVGELSGLAPGRIAHGWLSGRGSSASATAQNALDGLVVT